MDFASQNLTVGQLNAIVKKLGGEARAKMFLRDELVVRPPNPPVFPTRLTLKLGTGPKIGSEFLSALQDAGVEVEEDAQELLRKGFPVVSNEAELDFVVLTPVQLGLTGEKKHVTYGSFFRKAQEYGYELCPPEVGPQACLQFNSCPYNKLFKVAMEPLEDHHPMVFKFGRNKDGEFCLNVVWLYFGALMWGEPSEEFVFLRPRRLD